MVEIIPNWHPIFVHFAIGLLISSAAFFLAGLVTGHMAIGARLTAAGRWNLAVGLVAAAIALGTGFIAYNTVAHDGPSHANMTVHMKWAIGTLGVFTLAGLAAWFDRKRVAGASVLLLALMGIGAGTIGITGWYGAENVYRHGLGVMRLPGADDHAHQAGSAPHEHGTQDDHGSEGGGDHDHQPATAGEAAPLKHDGEAAPHHHDGDAPPHAHAR